MKSIVDFTNEIKNYFASKQALTNKFDKTGGTISGSISVITSTASATILAQDSSGNTTYMTSNSEGANVGGRKPNNTARFEFDIQPMNGSTGYARLMLGDATKINQKVFAFKEDGSFVDGKGTNLSDNNAYYTISVNASGMTGFLGVSINKTSRMCVISGYIDTTNKTSSALISASTDLDTCIANHWIPVSIHALPVWNNSGQFEYNNNNGWYADWTGTGGNNAVNCAFVAST